MSPEGYPAENKHTEPLTSLGDLLIWWALIVTAGRVVGLAQKAWLRGGPVFGQGWDATCRRKAVPQNIKVLNHTHQSGRSTHLMSIDHDSWKSGRGLTQKAWLRGGPVLGQGWDATCRRKVILQSIITPDIAGPSEWHASVRSPTCGTADNAWQNLDSDRVVSANARIWRSPGAVTSPGDRKMFCTYSYAMLSNSV
jgi:hypothetical protein